MAGGNQAESVLAVDIGTTSLKAALIGRRGEVFSFSRIEYSSLSALQKSSASEVWILAAKEALLNLNLDDSKGAELKAVCVSGNGPTIVSDDGTTLLYNERPLFAKEAARAESGENLFSKIDIPDAQKFVYEERLQIFRALYPEIWDSAQRLYSGPDYFAKILAEKQNEFGIPKSAQVLVCGPDFIAALIGTAALTPGRLCDRAGSSEGINLCLAPESAAHFSKEENLRVMKGIIQGNTNDTDGNGKCGADSADNSNNAAAENAAHKENAPAALCNASYLIENPGGTREEKTANFAKGIFLLREAAEKHNAAIDRTIIITGGQARDEKLIQEKADAADIRIALPQIPDAELLGDAAFAFSHLGFFSSIKNAAESLLKIKKIFYPLKAIIFDIDSTLYTNEEYAIEQVDCQVRHFARLRGITDDAARKMVSDYRKKYADENGGKRVSLANTLASFGVSIEQSIEWRKELLEPARFLSEDKLLQKTLSALSEKYKLLCVTNNPILPARKTLAALGVENFFLDVIGLDIFKKSKPAHEPFLLAAEKCGVLPQECMSVGDRYDIDLAPAAELGMRTLLVSGVQDVYRLGEQLISRAFA